MVAISVIPPAFVVSMVLLHSPAPEPVLEVRIKLGITEIAPRKSPDSRRILPCVTIENPTSEAWRNVAVSLNKEFFYYRPGVVAAGQNFSVPFEFFVTKGGNVAFQPGSESVRQVTVFAQIPTGARAISEKFFDSEGKIVEPDENIP